MSGIANWQAQIRIDIEDLKKRIKVAEGEINNFTNEDRKVKLDIDTKTLESAIQKLDKMLDSLGKGTSDFKQFENLSKELSSIVSEVQSLSKAFGKVDDSGTKTLLSSIQNIDKSLSELSQNILNVNKNMSNMGGNTSGAVKQVENITNESKKAASALEDVAKAQAKVNGQKANISSDSNPAIEQQNKLQEELKETQQQAEKARQSISELVKGRDVVSQNWYREKGTVIGKNSKGNDITRDADELSFVERLKNGQLQTVLATYNEETGKWAEQVINVRTAFEQVEKAIISADNKIASLEMTKEKTLAAHPGYDTTADDNQIAIERKKRDELQNTLNLYGQEKEYVFEIEAANKRIADNQERLNNKKQSQTNLRQAVSDEQFLKDWDAAIAENNKRDAESAKQASKELNEAWNSAIKVNNALDETKSTLSSLSKMPELTSNFSDMESKVSSLNSDLISGKITLSEYKNEVKSLTSEYSKMIDIQQKRDVEEYNAAANLRKTKTNQFKKIDDKFSKYSKQYTSLENSPAGYQHNDKYKAELEAYDNQLKAIKTKIQAIKDQDIDVVDQKDLSELDKMYTKLDKINDSLSHTPATQKGSTKESRQKVFNMINELKQFTGMARESKLELEAMEQRFKNLGTNLNVSEAIGEVKAFKAQLVATNQTTKNLLDTVKDKAWYGWAAQLAVMFSFYDVINSAQKAIDTVIKLDDALVDLKKTTAMNSTQLEQYYYDANDVAKQMGVTTEEIINQSSAWSRLNKIGLLYGDI